MELDGDVFEPLDDGSDGLEFEGDRSLGLQRGSGLQGLGTAGEADEVSDALGEASDQPDCQTRTSFLAEAVSAFNQESLPRLASSQVEQGYPVPSIQQGFTNSVQRSSNVGSREMGANGTTDIHVEETPGAVQQQFLDTESDQRLNPEGIEQEFRNDQYGGNSNQETLPMEQEILESQTEETFSEVHRMPESLPGVSPSGHPTGSSGGGGTMGDSVDSTSRVDRFFIGDSQHRSNVRRGHYPEPEAVGYVRDPSSENPRNRASGGSQRNSHSASDLRSRSPTPRSHSTRGPRDSMDPESDRRGSYTPPRGSQRTNSNEPGRSRAGMNSRIPRAGTFCHWHGGSCRSKVQEQCFISGEFTSADSGALDIQG